MRPLTNTERNAATVGAAILVLGLLVLILLAVVFAPERGSANVRHQDTPTMHYQFIRSTGGMNHRLITPDRGGSREFDHVLLYEDLKPHLDRGWEIHSIHPNEFGSMVVLQKRYHSP